MPHKEIKHRSSNGRPEIKKRIVVRNGKEYTYWNCQVTVGYNDLTGEQIQKTISRKSKADVLKELKEIERQIEENAYCKVTDYTFEDWGREWIEKYTNEIKPSSKSVYRYNMDKYVIPAIGHIKLKKLNTIVIQDFYNNLYNGCEQFNPLSEKTVKCIHGVVHASLDKAVALRMIPGNPSDACSLKKVPKPQVRPLIEDEIKQFLSLIQGHVHENLYTIALMTGLREGEILGLTWDNIDFDKHTVMVEKQLAKKRYSDDDNKNFVPTKNSNKRVLMVSDSVINCFAKQKKADQLLMMEAGELWQNKNLVFPNQVGDFLSYRTVYDCFKRIMKKMNTPEVRFHDLRHTYAFISLKSGTDIRTLQENMGHYSSAFTVDVYGYSSSNMKENAAKNLDTMIAQITET